MEALLDEIESLEAILMEDVSITRNADTGFPELIETTVFPTVGEDTDRQYICVTLQVAPSARYPDVSPTFKIQKPRGLDDVRLAEINSACINKLAESLGYPVVFDLIEVIREHLTGSNLPSGQCVVCLYGFQDGDEFTKTECYHYLHSYCLARHFIASRKNYNEEQDKLPAWQRKLAKPFEAVCPVCRETIHDEIDRLKTALPPVDLEMAPEFHLTDELKDLQAKMTNLFLHQKSRGGIIDAGAEDSNIISLESEDQSNDDRKSLEDVDGANEFGIVPVQQSNARPQQQIRSNHQHHNHHHHRGPNRNQNHSSPAANTQRFAAEPSNNNYSHHNRRHYQRGRRHHNYGHSQHHQSQQDGSQQQQPQQQPQPNGQSSCGSNTR